MVLEAVRATNGYVITVNDSGILAAQAELASNEGLFVCPEGAAAHQLREHRLQYSEASLMKQRRNTIISSSLPIVIQSICTSWTKASRGGGKASARNRTPEIFKLPAQAMSSSSKNTYLLQELFYEERNNFQQPEERLKKIETTDPFVYDCFRLSLHENTLRVIFEWEHGTEAPSRLDFPRTEISLQDHQWIRIMYNSRTSVGGWAYKKRVFNIGFLSPASLKEAPTHTYTDMAHLW